MDTWVNARTICAAEGATLAVPDTGYETLAIATIGSNAGFTETWVGLSDLETEGTWITVLGQPATHLPWAASEPDGGTVANCARLTESSVLLDDDCMDKFGFTCELAR